MAEKKYKYPAQVRTFLETIKGKKGKITEKDFSKEELEQIKQAIINARDPKDTKGFVDYDAYTTNRGMGDFDAGKSGAIRNTLGRFEYEKTPDKRLIAKDIYDFKDDLVKEAKVRPSANYPKNTAGKIATVVADTLFPTKNDGVFDYIPDPIKGVRTLPSRIGSAFIGADGRPVQIDLGEAPFKRGGKVITKKRTTKQKVVKKVSSASKRGDGCCIKGKTKGRFV
jgi:hypothetical protein